MKFLRKLWFGIARIFGKKQECKKECIEVTKPADDKKDICGDKPFSIEVIEPTAPIEPKVESKETVKEIKEKISKKPLASAKPKTDKPDQQKKAVKKPTKGKTK